MGKCTPSALLMFFCCVKNALCLGNFIRSKLAGFVFDRDLIRVIEKPPSNPRIWPA
jgi:hypothetical protein